MGAFGQKRPVAVTFQDSQRESAARVFVRHARKTPGPPLVATAPGRYDWLVRRISQRTGGAHVRVSERAGNRPRHSDRHVQ